MSPWLVLAVQGTINEIPPVEGRDHRNPQLQDEVQGRRFITTTLKRRTSVPFLSPVLHAMSYSHLGKLEGSQFPWERCSSLAASQSALEHLEVSSKERTSI